MAANSDLVLLEQWVERRDPEAFSEIVRRHSGMVYATGMRVLGNRAEAEDVAQDCFIKLAHSADAVKTSLAGWLHTMATRRALDRIKSESSRRQREMAYAEGRDTAQEPTWDDIQQFVDEAIADLNDDVRDLVIRHFLEGATHECLASELATSRSTVTRRIQQGIGQVRDALEKKGVPLSVGALGAGLAAQGAQAAPLALTSALGKLALAGSAGSGVAASAGVGATGLFSLLGLKSAVATVAVVTAGGGAWWAFSPQMGSARVAPAATTVETTPPEVAVEAPAPETPTPPARVRKDNKVNRGRE